ncbi:hypothetical protein [Emticicia sp. C21]|uniref:hypothetical protein n=1 Tax=Emticicia sp. C21 TaxID=2302915 RepID=UPI0011C1B3D3|nr:hypothetical protein [Emticicia sp. C21]
MKTQTRIGNLLDTNLQLAVRITTINMEEDKNLQANTVGSCITDYLPKYNEVETTQTEPEKVTNMVGTFWNPGAAKALITKTEPEKVTNMEGTFLKGHNDGCLKIVVMKKIKRVLFLKSLK